MRTVIGLALAATVAVVLGLSAGLTPAGGATPVSGFHVIVQQHDAQGFAQLTVMVSASLKDESEQAVRSVACSGLASEPSDWLPQATPWACRVMSAESDEAITSMTRRISPSGDGTAKAADGLPAGERRTLSWSVRPKTGLTWGQVSGEADLVIGLSYTIETK